MKRALAIIPARSGSKRLPGKNLRQFLGRPLIHWTIEFARSQTRFDEVMVSTDDESIAGVAREAGANVPWLRPAELATDSASTVDVVLHCLSRYADAGRVFDFVAVLQPTTPVRRAERWQEAFAAMDEGASAAVGVSDAPVHPFWCYRFESDRELIPFFPDAAATRSQLLPRACVLNGSLYLARCDAVIAGRTLVPAGARGVVCEEEVESVDIDTLSDWEHAEKLVRSHQRGFG
jgi:CMP-N-acetylneuraminic acid synthetase